MRTVWGTNSRRSADALQPISPVNRGVSLLAYDLTRPSASRGTTKVPTCHSWSPWPHLGRCG